MKLPQTAGYTHSLALKSDGEVIGWGYNVNVPTNLNNVVAIVAGYRHSLALKSNGQVIGWGGNSFDQAEVPENLSNNIVAIAAGWRHSLALTEDGNIIQWGYETDIPTTYSFKVDNVCQ